MLDDRWTEPEERCREVGRRRPRTFAVQAFVAPGGADDHPAPGALRDAVHERAVDAVDPERDRSIRADERLAGVDGVGVAGPEMPEPGESIVAVQRAAVDECAGGTKRAGRRPRHEV